MGAIQLIHGDCFELLQSFPDKSVDLILLDPPYGITRNRWDIKWDFEIVWQLVKKLSKNGLVICFGVGLFSAEVITSNKKDFKFNYVWKKNKATGHYNAKKFPMKSHEDIMVFSNSKLVYNPQKTFGHKPTNSFTKRNLNSDNCYGKGTKVISGGGSTERYPTTILEFKSIRNDDKERIHANQKPPSLYEYLIKTHSNVGDTVLDFGMGSGSSGIACLRTGRKYIGIEKNELIFSKAAVWIEKERNKIGLFKEDTP